MDIQEGQTKCHQDHKVFRPDLRDNRTHLWDTPLKVMVQGQDTARQELQVMHSIHDFHSKPAIRLVRLVPLGHQDKWHKWLR